MSIVEVKVPQLSESVAEATMLTWKKKAGEAVAVDEILIEIETDKVVLEVPAPSAGVLAEIIQPDGATVVADQLIAKIDTEGKAGAAAPAAAPAAAARVGERAIAGLAALTTVAQVLLNVDTRGAGTRSTAALTVAASGPRPTAAGSGAA